jgi:hypothetical protein
MSARLKAAVLLVAVAGFSVGAGSAVFGGVATSGPPIMGEAIARYAAPTTFPAAGTDKFESLATVTFDLGCTGNPANQVDIPLAGDTTVKRLAPNDADGDGRKQIPIEIISLSLQGIMPTTGDPVLMRENANLHSLGMVEDRTPGGQNFPADSFFDVFTELSLDGGQTWMYTQDPVRMQNARILGIPPIGSEYRSAGGPWDVFQGPTPVGCIVRAVHIPEDPSHILIQQQIFRSQELLYRICDQVSC